LGDRLRRYRAFFGDTGDLEALLPTRHMTEMKAITVGLALFALYLPVAVFVHSGYSQKPRPAGKAVEMILKFDVDKPRFVARSYVFSPGRYPNTSQIHIYEDAAPLPSANGQFTADGPAYVVRITTSDGSDPRSNGRQYWMVSP
jgi:hypothetical protein